MVVGQAFVDFKIPKNASISDDEIVKRIADLLKEFIGATELAYSKDSETFGKMLVFEANDKSQCTVRVFPDNLITLDIFYIDSNNGQEIQKSIVKLEQAAKGTKWITKTETIPRIVRGRDIKTYYETADGRLKEYDFDKIVHSETSLYQKILIVHSAQFGNMLFLDNIEMLAESDIAYTRAILGNGRENFENKTVLILGGGDGGIIHELLKEKPKFVIMVEIDNSVIEAAKVHLRSICGSTMDSFEGSNHKIIVDDCIVQLQKFVKNGKRFDYVLNDLTDIPISSKQDSQWDFIKEVVDLSLQVLNEDGKYFAQGTSSALSCPALEKYEQLLSNSHCPTEFRKEFVFVPSFLELWTFYEVWKC